MNTFNTRRQFLKSSLAAGAITGLGGWSFLARLPRVSAAEVQLGPDIVRFRPEIEPLVRLLEETQRERLLEEVAHRINRGLKYRDVLAALLLAGVRNIQPRPVGFKFHAVLVVNSAHLAGLASPDNDRWLPVFWALDYFKDAQARDVREGDWTMAATSESALPDAAKARSAFTDAMDRWDEPAADAAVTAFVRAAKPEEVFDVFCRYGARDFRDIGHKAIYVANSWRTLQHIGWQHAEPVMRSLAYALLYHEGTNPARRDASADRPGRENLKRIQNLRGDWLYGKPDPAATTELLQILRNESTDAASVATVEMLNRGVAPQSTWDALFTMAGELLMRRPGIVSLHAVTTTNALHFAFQTAKRDETRRFLLLQNAAFLPLFRGAPDRLKDTLLDELDPVTAGNGEDALRDIFTEISRDRAHAARKVLSYLQSHSDPNPFVNEARRWLFLKGNNSHDYKFTSAVLEDYAHVSPKLRPYYLAASVFNLSGSGQPDNELVKRTRAALSTG